MKVSFGWVLVTLLGVVVAMLAYLMVRELTAPPPMSFESIETPGKPAVPMEVYEVSATTRRVETHDCSNGPQADLRDGMGNIIRLPVPARTVNESTSVYGLIVPEGTKPGRFGLKLREVWNCSGRRSIIEAPWVFIMVGKADA